MTEGDNPEVSENEATEGQNQEGLLTGDAPQTTPQAEPTPESDTDWRSSLPDELKTAKPLQSIKSVEDLAKGFVNAQSVIGRRFEDLTPEQLSEYYGALGRPESPEDYKFEAPEGREINTELESWFRNQAFEGGLTKAAAEKLFNDFTAMEAETLAQREQMVELQMQEQQKQLQKDFGPAYDERVNLANRALREFGGDEAIAAITESGLQNHPALVKLLANAGETLAEGNFTSGQKTGKFGMTSEEASEQISKLRADPEFSKHYMDPSSSKHKEAASKLEELYKIKTANL